MKLTKEVFKIDPQEVSEKIAGFIRDHFRKMDRKGIVTPISGGLDSSVVVSLCVKAVGSDKVTGLMLPEKDGNDEAEKYAKVIAKHLGIKTDRVNITRTLRSIGIYNYLTCYIPTKKLRNLIARNLWKKDGGTFIKKCREGAAGERMTKLMRDQTVRAFVKQRVRMLHTFKYADEHDLAVVGCAHKSEDLSGLFVKFGVDDVADIMPIKNLFRSHLLQIGEYLKVPDEILGRTPNPDVIPGVTDKYLDILGVESGKSDLILYGLDNTMDPQEIADQVGVPLEKVLEIKQTMDKAYYQRTPCVAPEFISTIS